jgi:hypothetical protein
MKSKSIYLFIAFVAVSFASFADNTTSLSIVPTANANVYSISYKTREVGKVKISIYNKSNQLLFTETLTEVASFNRPYNFSELSEGEYTIVLEDKNGKQVEKVNYFMNKVKSLISITEVVNSENKYMLNVTNNGTDAVSVRIYDSAENLLHTQEVEVTGHFSLIYNLSKVKPAYSSQITFEVITSRGDIERITF